MVVDFDLLFRRVLLSSRQSRGRGGSFDILLSGGCQSRLRVMGFLGCLGSGVIVVGLLPAVVVVSTVTISSIAVSTWQFGGSPAVMNQSSLLLLPSSFQSLSGCIASVPPMYFPCLRNRAVVVAAGGFSGCSWLGV